MLAPVLATRRHAMGFYNTGKIEELPLEDAFLPRKFMSFVIACPNCGPRDVSEFRYGGQISSQSPANNNLPEAQNERWYHRHGCRRWLTARRDVRTNEVLGTAWLGEEVP